MRLSALQDLLAQEPPSSLKARCVLGLLLIVALVLGCQRGEPWPTDLDAVTHPDLGAVEEAARGQIEAARASLDTLLEQGAGEPRELGEAYGELGEIYHAYELLDAAQSCYLNAARLDPASFAWPYQRGLAAIAAGSFQDAIAAFERALELRSGDSATRLHLGAAYLATGARDKVNGLLEPLVEDPRYGAAAHAGLGRVALSEGAAETAIGHFEAALALQPGAGSLRPALAQALRSQGRGAEADEELAAKGSGEVVFPDPLGERLAGLARSAGSYLRRGSQALLAGRLDEAADLLAKAVDADSGLVPAHRNLALALVRKGEVAAAAGRLEKALTLHPDDAELYFDLGNCRVAQGDTERAVEAFRQAIELEPGYTEARFNLANLLARLERWTEASEQLGEVLAIRPDDRRARYLTAMADHHLGRSEDAATALQELLTSDPADLTARQGLLTVHAARNQAGPAAALVEEALSLGLPNEGVVPLLFDLGELEWRLRRRDASVGRFRRAVEMAPDSSDAHTRLANVLQLTDKRREAIGHFARAVELEPTNATAWLSEASLHVLERDDAVARQRLETALEKVPDHAGLNHTLARLLATSADAQVRDGRRAIGYARKAHAIEGSLEHAITIGMALAESGDFEKAIEWQRGLLQRAVQRRQPRPILERMARYLKLYENRRPVRISDG